MGHHTSECHNDWKCRNCGESGHKQIDCTKSDSAEGENIPHLYNDNTEYNEDDTSCYPSHQSNSDNNDDIDEDETQQPIDGAQSDDLLNCTIDRLQSILTTTTADKTNAALQKIDPPAARPKVLPARKSGPRNKLTNPDPVKQNRNTGQSQLTQFFLSQIRNRVQQEKMKINKSIRQQTQHLDVALKSHQ
ncbi:unnamed protein product [Mytilus coruscus]|uniref:CCHC-type domain-containing protein n=1 Tax=Mytilus coruscus TaxID=42192 RepID=A0A6J8BVL9_MYTCO|nr:unnamed protein product [Mytilus coruscus]